MTVSTHRSVHIAEGEEEGVAGPKRRMRGNTSLLRPSVELGWARLSDRPFLPLLTRATIKTRLPPSLPPSLCSGIPISIGGTNGRRRRRRRLKNLIPRERKGGGTVSCALTKEFCKRLAKNAFLKEKAQNDILEKSAFKFGCMKLALSGQWATPQREGEKGGGK